MVSLPLGDTHESTLKCQTFKLQTMKEENPIEESRRYVKNARKALKEPSCSTERLRQQLELSAALLEVFVLVVTGSCWRKQADIARF